MAIHSIRKDTVFTEIGTDQNVYRASLQVFDTLGAPSPTVPLGGTLDPWLHGGLLPVGVHVADAGDMDGNGRTDSADLAAFLNSMFQGGTATLGPCVP